MGALRQLIGFALAALLVATAATAMENHTRWNDQLNVCFYFYNRADGTSGLCYVPDQDCIITPHKPDKYITVDPAECRYSIATGTVNLTIANRPPILSNIADAVAREGDLVTLKPQCFDPDGGPVTIAFSGAMNSSEWQTGDHDAGTYTVTVTCTDARNASVSQQASIIVFAKNSPPYFKRPA